MSSSLMEMKEGVNFEEFQALLSSLGYVKPLSMVLETSDKYLI